MLRPQPFSYNNQSLLSPQFQTGGLAPLSGLGADDFRFGGSTMPLQMPDTTMPGLNFPSVGGGNWNTGMGALDAAKLGIAGLGTIGSLWSAFQGNKLAKKQFNFTKDFAERNMANQLASYNTALEDRGRSRAVVEGQSPQQAQSYIDKNRLKG